MQLPALKFGDGGLADAYAGYRGFEPSARLLQGRASYTSVRRSFASKAVASIVIRNSSAQMSRLPWRFVSESACLAQALGIQEAGALAPVSAWHSAWIARGHHP